MHGAFKLVDQALIRRKALLERPDLNAIRVFNGASDGLPGLVVERYGDVLIAQCHEGHLETDPEALRPLVSLIHSRLQTRAVYRKHFVRDRARTLPAVEAEHRHARPWIGEAVEEEIAVVENGLNFLIRPYCGFSVGLFLDHRDNRRWVREMAAGRRVLNLFSYTCAFSVAAAAGGAATVSSVDLSGSYLEWGKRNFTANDLPLEGHWFFRSDVFEFFKRATRQKRRYDLIIIDPPTFGRSGKGGKVFVIGEHLDQLCAGALARLDAGGHVLLATNNRQMSDARLSDALHAAASGRGVGVLDRPPLPQDFEGDPDHARTIIARVD